MDRDFVSVAVLVIQAYGVGLFPRGDCAWRAKHVHGLGYFGIFMFFNFNISKLCL